MAPAPKRRKTNPSSFPSMTSGYKSNTVRKQHKNPVVEELKFDPDARQEYLTGFHKRKLQRIKHAQEEAKKMAKEEAVVNRRELRQERKQDLERHVAEVNALLRKHNPDISDDEEGDDAADADSNDEWGGISEEPTVPAPDGVDEYVDEDKYTTVTIETMDEDPRKWDKEDEDEEEVATVVEEDKAEAAPAAPTHTASGKRIWTKEKPIKAKGDKTPKKKKQKFRYESKFERQQTRTKQRAKNRVAADARKAAAPTK